MNNRLDEYMVNCNACDDEFEAFYVDDDLWSCDNCGKLFDGESGRITNLTEKREFEQSFKGTKIAGMLNTEEEFIGDKEQMKSERW
jgi:ribosomal protein L37AE/L43A